VKCTLVIPSMKAETTHRIHMHKPNGYWRICDFTMGRVEQRSVTELLRERSWGEDLVTDMAVLLEGKDLFEALAEVRDLRAVARPESSEKPLLNWYVRTDEPCKLVRGGQHVTIEKGTLLKVLDQWRDQDPALLLVRTAEADAAKSATGEIPETIVIPVGVDEEELWGTETASSP